MRHALPVFLGLLSLAFTQCSSPDVDGGAGSGTAYVQAANGTTAAFDLHADITQSDSYWSFPYPSDLRLTADHRPNVAGFPNATPRGNIIVASLATSAGLRRGFDQTAVAYFAMSAPIAARNVGDVIPADASQSLLLVDIDPTSPERGKLWPLIATTPPKDAFTPDNLLAVAPRPGVLLRPDRTYAVVVRRSLGDATGAPLGVPQTFASLSAPQAPAAGSPERAAWDLYRPLWPTLGKIGVPLQDVAVATVFTTGDPVRDTEKISSRLLATHSGTIKDLAVRADGNQPRQCEITGKITLPQFQQGVAPFDTDGRFDLDRDGIPRKQRDEDIPIALSLPQHEMPAGGYPLVLFEHGSGGLSTQVLDRGIATTALPDGTPHQGPAYVLAPHGFATAGAAMPVNPERVPGANPFAYLNPNNIGAFTYDFLQGVIEQRLLLSALADLRIDPAVVAQCTGVALPAGASAYRFDLSRLGVEGQSMGGQYANLLSAVEPRVGAVVPTGAGGQWSQVILTTKIEIFGLPVPPLVAALLDVPEKNLSILHPALSLLQLAFEPADAFIYMRRISRSPLAGHPVRDIYEPVGFDDEYFQPPVYDAVALSYAHKQAGEIVWPSMQQALAVSGLDGIVPYPVTSDLRSEDGRPYTGAVVQYKSDGFENAHYIFQQLDDVKYQYGCFFETFQKTGRAIIAAPKPLGTPCPDGHAATNR